MAVLFVACNEPKDDLLANYQAHVSEALEEVGQFRENGMNWDSKTMMEHNVGDHMNNLSEVRGKMMEQCKMDRHCSDGGGATGEMDGGHMSGGQYLDPSRMTWMMEKEQEVSDEMKSMDEHCDGQSENVEACWDEHTDIMEGTLDDMAQACSDMISGNKDNKEMMDGGAGMMGAGGM
jgi:hypothetical protein